MTKGGRKNYTYMALAERRIKPIQLRTGVILRSYDFGVKKKWLKTCNAYFTCPLMEIVSFFK